MTYANVYSNTPQTEALHGQVANNTGGYSFQISDWQRLDRFLVLGTEGGSYYVGERKLTKENADVVKRCLDSDYARTIKTIVDVSTQGKAAKQDAGIFALAMASGHHNKEARKMALNVMPQVCRTGTTLFQFMEYSKQFRGTGRAFREGVGAWYTGKPADKLGYQMVKYRQRNGWTHADVLRLAHPKPADDLQSAMFKWATSDTYNMVPNVDIVKGFAYMQKASTEAEVIAILNDHSLPWETVPTQFLNSPSVWNLLLDNGSLPLGALIRQLPRLTSIGVVDDRRIELASKIRSHSELRSARIHPLGVLNAKAAYESGHSRGALTWMPDEVLSDALEDAFYASFEFVTPANKRTYIGLDVSGSMDFVGKISGMAITPRVASAALCLVTARSEPDYRIRAFTHGMKPIAITSKTDLSTALRITDDMPFGGTDCSMPMLDALENGHQVDTFVVYTDSETWAGRVHPSEALKRYRKETGIPAKLIVVGMVSNGFSIADPNDAGMLDVVGMSTETPATISKFSAGLI